MPGDDVLDRRVQNYWHEDDERYVRRGERAVQELDRLGFEAWASKYEYSLRWMIEYVFSAVKRTLGGEVRARRRDLMFFEVENKFWTWNEMRRADLCN